MIVEKDVNFIDDRASHIARNNASLSMVRVLIVVSFYFMLTHFLDSKGMTKNLSIFEKPVRNVLPQHY